LIATARGDLVTCAKDETLAKVVKDTGQNQFDFRSGALGQTPSIFAQRAANISSTFNTVDFAREKPN